MFWRNTGYTESTLSKYKERKRGVFSYEYIIQGRMAIWEKSTTVLHDPTKRKRINCRDCVHCDEEGFCDSTDNVIDSNNTDLWKHCGFFELSEDAYNFEEKDKQFEEWREKRRKANKVSRVHTIPKIVTNNENIIKYDWMNNKPYSFTPSLSQQPMGKPPKAIVKRK